MTGLPREVGAGFAVAVRKRFCVAAFPDPGNEFPVHPELIPCSCSQGILSLQLRNRSGIRANSARRRAESVEIPCIFPVDQGIRRRDEFARDCLHRHIGCVTGDFSARARAGGEDPAIPRGFAGSVRRARAIGDRGLPRVPPDAPPPDLATGPWAELGWVLSAVFFPIPFFDERWILGGKVPRGSGLLACAVWATVSARATIDDRLPLVTLRAQPPNSLTRMRGHRARRE